MPKASIVMRTRNEGEDLDQVLAMLHRQSEQAFEIILVDSQSSDGTVRIARRYGAHVISIQPETFTYGYALNLGIARAQSPVAVSLSGHALPRDDRWLEHLLNEFTDPRVAGTCSAQIARREYYRPLSRAFFDTLYASKFASNGLVSRFLFNAASAAIRVSVWKQFPFDEKLAACEDHDWARRIVKGGYKITYCPSSQVYHSHELPLPPRLERGLRDAVSLARIYINPHE